MQYVLRTSKQDNNISKFNNEYTFKALKSQELCYTLFEKDIVKVISMFFFNLKNKF